MKDGETRAPEGLVDVSMQFANRRSSTDQNISWKLYYVTSDGIEDLTDDSHSQNDAKINTNDAGEVTDLSFKTDKFNIFVLAAIKTEAVEKAKEGKSSGTLTAEADGAKATLKYENSAVEEGTQLIISADSEKKASIQPLIEKSLKSSDSKQEKVVALYPYSLSLKKDGSTVQPAKEVEVTVDFTSALTTTAANGTWHVYHMDAAGQLEDVTDHADIQTDEIGAVTQVRFMASSLSEYVIASIDTKDVKTGKDITLSAEKNGIQVTVKADCSVIEDGTELVLTDDKYAKSDIVGIIDKNLESENTIKEEKSAADVYPFGLSLVKDGKTVSLKGAVSVEVNFTEKAKSNVEKAQWRVYRLNSKEEAKDITDSTTIHRDDSNAVDKISFETKTLSDYALVNVKTTEIKESTKKLTAKADGVSVSLSYKKGVLPEGTKLTVKEKASTEDAISSINTLIRKTSKRSYVVDNYMFSFELTCDGKTVEPEGTVTVQIDLEKGLTAGKVNAAWRVFHFKNDGSINEITEDDNSLNLISSGKVLNSIEFKTDSFSAYAVTSVSSKLVLMRAAKNALPLSLNDNENEGYVTGASFYVMTKEGKRVDNPESVNDGDDIYLTLNYKIPKDVKLSDHNNQVTYQFDDHLKAVMEDSGNIIDKTDNSKILGAYKIDKNGLVTLTFTDENCLNGTRDVTGDFSYHARVENSDTRSDHTITIAGTGTTINIKAKEEDLTVKKSTPVVSYTSDSKIKLRYTVEATSTTGTSSAVTFTDTPTVYNYDNVTISNPKAYYIDSTSSDYNSGNGIPIEQSGNKVTTHQSLDSSHKIVLVYDIMLLFTG